MKTNAPVSSAKDRKTNGANRTHPLDATAIPGPVADTWANGEEGRTVTVITAIKSPLQGQRCGETASGISFLFSLNGLLCRLAQTVDI